MHGVGEGMDSHRPEASMSERGQQLRRARPRVCGRKTDPCHPDLHGHFTDTYSRESLWGLLQLGGLCTLGWWAVFSLLWALGDQSPDMSRLQGQILEKEGSTHLIARMRWDPKGDLPLGARSPGREAPPSMRMLGGLLPCLAPASVKHPEPPSRAGSPTPG